MLGGISVASSLVVGGCSLCGCYSNGMFGDTWLNNTKCHNGTEYKEITQ